MQINPYVSLCTKHKPKCIKDLNIKLYTLNLTEVKVGNNLELIVTGDDFLIRTQVVKAVKLTINKQAFMKLKDFYKAKTQSIGQSNNL